MLRSALWSHSRASSSHFIKPRLSSRLGKPGFLVRSKDEGGAGAQVGRMPHVKAARVLRRDEHQPLFGVAECCIPSISLEPRWRQRRCCSWRWLLRWLLVLCDHQARARGQLDLIIAHASRRRRRLAGLAHDFRSAATESQGYRAWQSAWASLRVLMLAHIGACNHSGFFFLTAPL